MGRALAVSIEISDTEHGDRIAGGGGLLDPFARLGVVLGRAPAVLIEKPDREHGARHAGGGGLLEPFARLGVVLLRPKTPVKQDSHHQRGGTIPFLRDMFHVFK